MAEFTLREVLTVTGGTYRGRSSSPVRWLDFKSSWGRQRSRAGSTPVIFRQLASTELHCLK